MNTTLTAPRLAPLGPVPGLCASVAALGGACAFATLGVLGGHAGAVEGVLCALPLAAVAVLGCTSQADREQYVLRQLAAVLMLPLLLQMWVLSEQLPVSQATHIATAFGLLLAHLAACVALLWRLAQLCTRIEAMAGTRPASAALLAARLRSLHAGGLPWALHRGASDGEWRFAARDKEGSAHVLQLFIDEARAELRMRHRVGAAGSAPRDADEASLRSLGDATIDGTRPEAQAVWSRRWQAVMLKPEQLAAVRLRMHGVVAQSEHALQKVDPDALVALLAVLAIRSGLAWQPTLSNPAR